MNGNPPSDHPAQSVREAAARLLSLTDELNQGLQRAEDIFIGWNLGVRAAVPLDALDELRGTLAFGKLGSKWCLIHVPHGGHDQVRIFEASRRVRLLAATCIQALAAKLVCELEAQLVQLSAATTKLSAACDGLDATTGRP